MLIFCGIGLYGYALTVSNPTKYGWLIPDVFLFFTIAGMVMGAVASALYIVDGFRGLAVEAFTVLLIFKNMWVTLFLQKLPWKRYYLSLERTTSSLMAATMKLTAALRTPANTE